MNRTVDGYLAEGCGRCAKGGTPACKVHRWQQALQGLRSILLSCGLTEESKWGVPCYTFQGHNVVIAAAFNDYCALSFFKGALLSDADGLLVKPSEHSQAARLITFTQIEQVAEREAALKATIFEAIEVQRAGLKVDFQEKHALVYPLELQQILDEDAAFAAAFNALTPGRRRAYNLYFAAPKKSQTRISRIANYHQKILDGKGLNE